ncbi:MAG: hypothetical protein GEV11_10750 [Streptosporangiales bacterium]|nr:hypothetical protein [Streptosporangiales bacterium]
MPSQVHFAIIALNLLAGAGLLVLLGVLTWVSWVVARTRATTRHHILHTTRQRLVPGLWVALCLFVATSMYGELNNAAMSLPNAWQIADAGQGQGYAMLSLGGHLFIVQVALGLGVLTVGALAEGGRRASGGPAGRPDLAVALVSSSILAATLFAVVAMAAVGYVQLIAHTVSQGNG